ncbi:hypothetical protein E4T56_gene480 [Termitomyces sp. T112]|nr:hypothetical protein E4T56_gene480 [Termitomyces sp. T112]
MQTQPYKSQTSDQSTGVSRVERAVNELGVTNSLSSFFELECRVSNVIDSASKVGPAGSGLDDIWSIYKCIVTPYND